MASLLKSTLNTRPLSMTVREAEKKDYKQIRDLYNRSFPDDERAPFWMIRSKVRRKRAAFLLAEDNGEFVGFVYYVLYQDLMYFFYFAVAERMRKKGYGSQILQAVKERYEGKRIFLAREQLDESADNYAERVSRREFYLKNGFLDLPCRIKEGKVIYDAMGIGGTFTAEEYDALITFWGGRLWQRTFDMRAIEL